MRYTNIYASWYPRNSERINQSTIGRSQLSNHLGQYVSPWPSVWQIRFDFRRFEQIFFLSLKMMLSLFLILLSLVRPGPDVIAQMGGLHKFMNWKRGILTDSGGFQMVSLLKLAEITEEGVRFQSPHDGSQMILSPEMSIEMQNKIGADIIMALDDVVSTTTTGPRVEEAMYRTLRWLDRCIAAHSNPYQQNLFGIVQGGINKRLREICLEGLVARNLPGYAIGGLSGGEAKDHFWRIVSFCTECLPIQKPRYLMGVGYALDLVTCVALGIDMFDCVFPSRTARFGNALVRHSYPHSARNTMEATINGSSALYLKSTEFAGDHRPIDDACNCMVCKTYSRAYLHTLAASKEQLSCQLLTYHNIAFQMRLMQDIRTSIVDGTFPNFVRQFVKQQYPQEDTPQWAIDALQDAGNDNDSRILYTSFPTCYTAA